MRKNPMLSGVFTTPTARTALIALALAAGMSTASAQNGGGAATAPQGGPATTTPDNATAPEIHNGAAMQMLQRARTGKPAATMAAGTPAASPAHAAYTPAEQAARLDRRMKMLTEKLKLTPEQQADVKPLLQDQATHMAAVDTKFQNLPPLQASRADQLKARQAVRDDTNVKLAKVLTPEQMQQFTKGESQGMARYSADALKRLQPTAAPTATPVTPLSGTTMQQQAPKPTS